MNSSGEDEEKTPVKAMQSEKQGVPALTRTAADAVQKVVPSSSPSSQHPEASQVEEIHPTDCKPNQCMCGIEFALFEVMGVHKGSVHAGDCFQCSGYWQKKKGLQRCTYKSKDPGTIWKHYRTQHCGLFFNYCTVADCK